PDPEAGHDAIRRPFVLHLDPSAAPGLVPERFLLRDYTVEAAALEALHPLPGDGRVPRRRREVERRRRAREQFLEERAAFDERPLAEIEIVDGEEIETDEGSRRARGQLGDPRA